MTRSILRTLSVVFGLVATAGASCPGTIYDASAIHFDTLPDGSVVTTQKQVAVLPKVAAAYDTLAISSPAGLKAHLQS